jgi:hypothetical protein
MMKSVGFFSLVLLGGFVVGCLVVDPPLPRPQACRAMGDTPSRDLSLDSEGRGEDTLTVGLEEDVIRSWQAGFLQITPTPSVTVSGRGPSDRALARSCSGQPLSPTDGGVPSNDDSSDSGYPYIPPVYDGGMGQPAPAQPPCGDASETFTLQDTDFDCNGESCAADYRIVFEGGEALSDQTLSFNAHGRAHGLWCGNQGGSFFQENQVLMTLE